MLDQREDDLASQLDALIDDSANWLDGPTFIHICMKAAGDRFAGSSLEVYFSDKALLEYVARRIKENLEAGGQT